VWLIPLVDKRVGGIPCVHAVLERIRGESLIIKYYTNECFTSHTHTTVLWPSWILSRTTRVSWQQKGKTNQNLLEQERVSGSGISWAICKSAP